MIQFEALVERFQEKGEKTGWTYIEIHQEMAEALIPGNKKSFRVKGSLDNYIFEYIALIPMGNGGFIMPLNAEIRKGITKQQGDTVQVKMEVDQTEKALSTEFLLCLNDDPVALDFFKKLPKGHQRYFSNWIESAKTETTKTKRITQALVALGMKLGFGEMVRMNKKKTFE